MFPDLRLACRSLAKTPGFTAVALLTLALGIGVNTSMYSLVEALLFRSAPFPEADRLAIVQGTTPQSPRGGFSFAELEEMRAAAAGPSLPFESLTTYAGWNNTLAEPGQPAERLFSIDATADFFTTFRVQPMLGRPYTADEQVPGRNQVALLSHSLWQSRFAGDPNIVGRVIRLNAESVTVIGVMPADFAYPLLWGKVDLWRPITIPRHIVESRHNRFFTAIARLAPGATAENATARLAPLAAGWAKDYPQHDAGRGFKLETLHKATMDSTGTMIVWLLFGLGVSVLLIACANLANLQLARATASARDLAIRAALGASRARLVRHQLTESLLLGLAGGAGGLIVTLWVNSTLSRSIRIGNAELLSLPVDFKVLGVALTAALLTGILFGLAPAWFASRAAIGSALKQQTRSATSGRGPRLVRHGLIVAEVALALALLGVAGVMIRGFDALLKKNPGWDTDRLLVANIHLPEQSTYNTEDKRRIVIDRLTRRIAEIPGAEHTTIATTVPTFGYSKTLSIHVDGKTSGLEPQHLPTAGYTMVGADYFQTMGIPLREGKSFASDLKADSPPVAIVNESLAQKFWPGESAIGRRIGDQRDNTIVWREIVGVVRDIQFSLNHGHPSTMLQVYKPLVHEPWGYLHLVVRAAAPASFKTQLRRAVTDIDPDVAVQDLYTLPESADRFQHNIFVVNHTLLGFALLGLVLAAVGLYGVISHLVAQRTGEFGIRLALGAKPSNVLALVLGTGVKLTLVGLVLGGALAYALNRMLASAMPRVAAPDPVTLGGVSAILLLVALLACWIPARRATKVDPIVALRSE